MDAIIPNRKNCIKTDKMKLKNLTSRAKHALKMLLKVTLRFLIVVR